MQVALILVALTVFMFFGAGLYAVWNGEQDQAAQQKTDMAICGAVNGLRQDFVEVIEDQKERALKNIKKLGLDVEQAEKDYDEMLNKIGDEECP